MQRVLRDWDPIGVGPKRSDEEYRRYALKIVRMIDGGCDRYKLAQWLGQIRINAMGLSANPKADDMSAQRLMELAEKI